MAQRVAKQNTIACAGFSLVEVLIALTLFAVVSAVLSVTVTTNLNSSRLGRIDITLHNLAEFKMNEVLISNREFTTATNNSEDTGNFEIEGYKEYRYKVEIRKMELPDLAAIMGQTEDEQNRIETQETQVRKRVFAILKRNLEEIIWQVRVEVTSPDNDFYELTSWVEKGNAQIDRNFGL